MAAGTTAGSIHRVPLISSPELRVVLRLEGLGADRAAAQLDQPTRELLESILRRALLANDADDTDRSTSASSVARFGHSEDCVPPQALRLATRLRSGSAANQEARIRAAYLAGRTDGLLANSVLAGEQDLPKQVPYPEEAEGFAPKYFVVLIGVADPFWIKNRSKFLAIARPNIIAEPGVVVRQLSILSELEAFLSGVGAEPTIAEA